MNMNMPICVFAKKIKMLKYDSVAACGVDLT